MAVNSPKSSRNASVTKKSQVGKAAGAGSWAVRDSGKGAPVAKGWGSRSANASGTRSLSDEGVQQGNAKIIVLKVNPALGSKRDAPSPKSVAFKAAFSAARKKK